MSAEQNWKQAASREGVDYDAVMKSFMDQAYGVVANKAKILFQDPFRLGFEIIHRNEKATKMVGSFAFRVNKTILKAPVFFVNGEIKPADMIYRSDVKRFVPLTEDWCAALVRGVSEQAGDIVDRDRRRQPDSHMDRLAYPQRVKYAADDSQWREFVAHCADDAELEPLLPKLINGGGPEILEKLAELLEDHEGAQRYLVENYTEEQLTTAGGWLAKKAAEAPADPEDGTISVVLDPMLCKAAAARDKVMEHGFALIDKRAAESVNTVIEEIDDDVIEKLSAPAFASIMLDDGASTTGCILKRNDYMFDDDLDDDSSGSTLVLFLDDDEVLKLGHRDDVYGTELLTSIESALPSTNASDVSSGSTYVVVNAETMRCHGPVVVTDVRKDGDSTVVRVASDHMPVVDGGVELVYAPGRKSAGGRYIGDSIVFVKIKATVEYNDDDSRVRGIEPECGKTLMAGDGVSEWMRTAGGAAPSSDIVIRRTRRDLFDITRVEGGSAVKSARDLGRLEAQLSLAEDFCISCDAAGDIVDKAVDRDVSYRVFDTITKSGYMTRAEGMDPWIEGFDPVVQVKLDTPQKQVLSTFTPKRAEQTPRYGDHFERPPSEPNTGEHNMLPDDAIFGKSPEELASMSDQMGLSHIFDHGCMERLATTSFNIAEQIRQYIPDLEAGVDRLFRILFLLRYRPADFEESYGKDALLEMEQDLSELAGQSGENLLRLLQRFDSDQYSAQSD